MSAPPRFSKADQVEIIAATGLRYPLHHTEGDDYDRIDVILPHRPGCSYRLERDVAGCTYLLMCTPDDLRLLVCGTLAECLKTFRQRSAP